MTKENKKVLIWSHAFFAPPILIAISHNLYLYGLIVAATAITSLIYHLHPKTHWHFADHATALLLIASNFYLFKLTSFFTYYFAGSISMAFVGLLFYFQASKKNYYLDHTIWHLLSAVITTLSVIGFIRY